MNNYIAINPTTGLHIREASAAEVAAYLAQAGHAAFRKPVLVGDVLIDEYTGAGIWFGGAGF